MARAITVRGHLSDARHIELDQPVDTPQGPVEVVLRPAAGEQKDRASIVGLFADEPELMDDEISDSAMGRPRIRRPRIRLMPTYPRRALLDRDLVFVRVVP